MPAPLARGIIISISMLIAAGIAVYENPQVRQWIDENRRKLALALHGLGDEVHPGSPFAGDDVSLREDNSPDAIERRRIARQAILERARMALESRDVPPPPGQPKRGASFDDFVDDEGNLKDKPRDAAATTGIERHEGPGGSSTEHSLRNRATEAAGLARGTAAANPFSDEVVMSYNIGLGEEEALEWAKQESRAASLSSLDTTKFTATVAPATDGVAPSSDEGSSGNRVIADEAARSETSESEVLLDLTPTTSRAPSSFHPVATPGSAGSQSPAVTPRTPRSTASGVFESLPHNEIIPQANLPPSATSPFQSIHEWAASSTASFYSPAESDLEATVAAMPPPPPQPAEMREIDAELVSRPASTTSETLSFDAPGSDRDLMEVLSAGDLRSLSGASTPGAWTDVGSVVSEEEHRL